MSEIHAGIICTHAARAMLVARVSRLHAEGAASSYDQKDSQIAKELPFGAEEAKAPLFQT